MDVGFLTPYLLQLVPILKIVGLGFLFILILFLGFTLIIWLRRKKWKIEIHEQKADGEIYTVGRDTLLEKKLDHGTKTVYWLSKAKQEVVPPPDRTVDRYRNKEEVDYLRIERDIIPATKRINVNYNDPRVKKLVIPIYDRILKGVRSVKTTYFRSDAVRDRWVFIPIKKTLTANMEFEPIPYDMHMTALNEIHTADRFFESKYEFWKKYGAIIVFGLTVVFLIIISVLSFDYMKEVVGMMAREGDRIASALEKVSENIGIARPPS